MKRNTNSLFTIFAIVLFFSWLNPLQAALTDGLIVQYDFESVTGTQVLDASHHNNTGTLMGESSVGVGFSGNGVMFSTVNDYLLMPEGLVNSLTNFSITSWVKINSLSNWSRLFDFGSGQAYNMFLTPSSGNGNLRFAITNDGAEQQINAPSALKTNEWVHVAVTYSWGVSKSIGVGKLYVNGLLVGTNETFTVNPSMLPQTTQNYLAKSQYQDPALNGTVDDFRVYNRTLTDAEILEMNGYTTEMLEAYNSIALTGDLTKVTANLSLPKVAGTANIPISWSSSSVDVITTEGIVTRPKYFDQTVTLKATLSMIKDGKTVSMTKEFNVTVLASLSKHWESLILENDVWKYFVATSEPAASWYQSSYNDANWASAKGGFGFGDSDDTTTIATCNSVYLRKQIVIPDVTQIDNLVLDIDYDDAFVFYINGVECARSTNVVGTYPAYNKALTSDHEAKMYKGGAADRFQLKASMLVSGTNTFAVQVLNQNISSSDLSSRVFVHVRLRGAGISYHATPSWFVEPADQVSYDESTLPFIMVNTNGQSIVQSSRITADMKVLNSDSGLNNINDTVFAYNGKIGIEIRGFTSAGFPKKSYSVETRTDSATNLNVKLLGLPKENDWVFNGPYPDKSLMRNVLAYHLGNLTGTWSPRTKYFELYLNGAYQGVYILIEKIKMDKNRLPLASLTAADTTGDELTGGYILKLDRPEATDVANKDYWISPYAAWTTLKQKEYFLFQDPKGDELHTAQFNYIRKCLTDFEDAMYSDDYKDKVKGYFPMIDMNSFVDYYILTELSRNLDGYRISTFIHKDKDSKGGKIKMGPYWDYDICYGNANFFAAGVPEGWIIDGMGNGDSYAMPFWWEKFRLDPYFNDQLKKRWNYWTANYINTTYLNHVIDSCSNELVDAQKRNFQTWNILNVNVWPNNYVGGTYANEIGYLKSWLNSRITWMDTQIQALQELPDQLSTDRFPMDLAVYPNPFVEKLNFKFYLTSSSRFELQIHDLMGRTVYRYEADLDLGLHEFPISVSEITLASPMYQYQVKVNGVVRKTGKLIRKGL